MLAVSGIDHRAAGALGHESRRARQRVPNHHQLDASGDDVAHGVEQRLAFGGRRALRRPVEHLGPECLGGELERRSRTRGRLEEKVGDCLARQGPRGLARLAQAFGRREQRLDFFPLHAFESEQVRQLH
jgi:hypothetical protein